MDHEIETEILPESLIFEKADVVLANLSGQASRYSPQGARNFMVVLTDEKAQELLASDIPWRVRLLTIDDENSIFVLPVHLRVDSFYGVSTVSLQGHTLEIKGLSWKTKDRSGVKAYLESSNIE